MSIYCQQFLMFAYGFYIKDITSNDIIKYGQL